MTRALPTAVLIDAGDTLFRERASRAQTYHDIAARHRIGLPRHLLGPVMQEVHDTLPREIDGAYRYSRGWFLCFIEQTFARMGYVGPIDSVARDLFEHFDRKDTFELFPESRAVIKRLKGAGVPVAVVSNWSPRLTQLLGRFGLLADFGAVVISAVARMEKPSPEIFRRALAELGVQPHQAIHVGDHPLLDADGANRVGIRGILLDRKGRHPSHPDRISNLAEILPILGIDRNGIPTGDDSEAR